MIFPAELNRGQLAIPRRFRWDKYPPRRLAHGVLLRWQLDYGFVTLVHGMQHLLKRITGGSILNNQTIIDYGIQLTDACWNTYASTL